MLNVELIPFVGLKVDEYTPLEKYEDLAKTPTHYSLNNNSLQEDFKPLGNFFELKQNETFQQARKVVHKKDFLVTDTYNHLTQNIAVKLDLSLEPKREMDILSDMVNKIDKKNNQLPTISSNELVGDARADSTVITFARKEIFCPSSGTPNFAT